MLCKLLLPNFRICSFLASPPAPCWMKHSGYSVPSWEWGDGDCKDMLTSTRRSRNSLLPLPFMWGKGSSQHSQLQGLVANHQCPCFISSDCISLTFYPACLLQTNFWQAHEWAQGFWPPLPCCAHNQYTPPFQWVRWNCWLSSSASSSLPVAASLPRAREGCLL